MAMRGSRKFRRGSSEVGVLTCFSFFFFFFFFGVVVVCLILVINVFYREPYGPQRDPMLLQEGSNQSSTNTHIATFDFPVGGPDPLPSPPPPYGSAIEGASYMYPEP